MTSHRNTAVPRALTRNSLPSSKPSSASTSPRSSDSWLMMWNYIRFDFGESYFRSIDVIDLIAEKAAGVNLAGRLDSVAFLRDLDSARDQESQCPMVRALMSGLRD
jgi:hypothetical protein